MHAYSGQDLGSDLSSAGMWEKGICCGQEDLKKGGREIGKKEGTGSMEGGRRDKRGGKESGG